MNPRRDPPEKADDRGTASNQCACTAVNQRDRASVKRRLKGSFARATRVPLENCTRTWSDGYSVDPSPMWNWRLAWFSGEPNAVLPNTKPKVDLAPETRLSAGLSWLRPKMNVLDFPDARTHAPGREAVQQGPLRCAGALRHRLLQRRPPHPDPRNCRARFQDLKKAGLIASKRGPRGGYQLARPAEEISIGDVIRALEGPVAVLINEEEPGTRRGVPDPTAAVFRDLSASVEKCFDAITIADVCHRGAELGVRKKSRERITYVI